MDDLKTYLSSPAASAMSDADALAGYLSQPPTPRISPIQCTYLWLGTLDAPFGGNTSGTLRTGLLAWCNGIDLSTLNAALPNPGQLQAIHARLDGYPGIDLTSAQSPAMIGLFASGVPTVHAPLLTAAQAAAMLSFGYEVVPPATLTDVTAARAYIVDRLTRLKISGALASIANEWLVTQPTAPTAASIASQLQSLLAAAGVA